MQPTIEVRGASEHNLKSVNLSVDRGSITVVTGVSGSGKSSLAFDTILAESQRRFFYTLSHYSRQFLDVGTRPAVQQISGLSPAISLAQNETMPSRKATVGTLTDISELLGVMLARFGDAHCPEHGKPTAQQSVEDVVLQISKRFTGETVAICTPLAEQKKGHFRTQMTRWANRGFMRAFVDGDIVNLATPPELVKEEKHTIKLIVDQIKVQDKSLKRLQRSIEAALDENDGIGEFFLIRDKSLDLAQGGSFSLSAGCPDCGFAWPALDSRYFSSNSLGKCLACAGYGVAGEGDEDEGEHEITDDVLELASLKCQSCDGTGVAKKMKAIKLGDLTMHDFLNMHLDQLVAVIKHFTSQAQFANNPAFMRVQTEVASQLQRICDVGISYLTLSRRIVTLSAGESQRLKLASILGENLRGVLYVLDEPSQGLHSAEVEQLCRAFKALREQGNTVIVVDHDETVMRNADWIVDLGPGGGARGGNILAKFKPQDAMQWVEKSGTAAHLVRKHQLVNERSQSVLPEYPQCIEMSDLSLHNLQIDQVRFPKGLMSVVTGVSGAGKSSLVLSTLFENTHDYIGAWNGKEPPKKFKFKFCKSIKGLDDYDQVMLIDRRPVAKSFVSMPATYLDVFGPIRDLYAALPESKVAGLTARQFSLHVDGGRCEECKGRGEIALSMRFLPDARVRCHVCHGMRYRPHVLAMRYNQLNISETLNLTIAEAFEHFKNFKTIVRRLRPAMDLGLGYLKMGQPSASLSGGEAQRLKMVPYLVKKVSTGSLLIMDEPTTGLHFEDVERLIRSVRRLVDQGATVIMVEHSLDVVKAADWVVDLGPGAASAGGKLLYQGAPRGLAKVRTSPTGTRLDSLLD